MNIFDDFQAKYSPKTIDDIVYSDAAGKVRTPWAEISNRSTPGFDNRSCQADTILAM
jgi:hypothetical protein